MLPKLGRVNYFPYNNKNVIMYKFCSANAKAKYKWN